MTGINVRFRLHRFIFGVAAMGLLLAAASPANAQRKKLAQVKEKTLNASDGWPIAITYYESTDGKDAPVVILLHMKKGNRQVWKGGFAKQLQNRGFAVIAVDLRKHGDSKPAGAAKAKGRLTVKDYKAMAYLDLEAVKDFIYEEHQKQKLNMRKTAIVAPEFSAPIALAFAEYDWLKKPHPDAPTLPARTPRGQDIRAIVLISPEKSVPGISSSRTAANISKISNAFGSGVTFLVVWGNRDVVDSGRPAKEIYDRVARIPANKRNKLAYSADYNTRSRGTDLVGKAFRDKGKMIAVNTILGNFLTQKVKDLKDEWVNRESRLTRPAK